MNNFFTRKLHSIFRKNETKLHILNYLFWECTWRCNLKCLHCGSDCKSSSAFPDMPFEDFLNAIQPLKKQYPKNSVFIAIMGGEPLLRKDLPECGKKLRDNGFRWGIVTNGYGYDEAMHAKLISAGMGSITVSLDGLDDNHNWLRNNPKSFERAVKALELIVSYPRLTLRCRYLRTAKKSCRTSCFKGIFDFKKYKKMAYFHHSADWQSRRKS